MLDVEFEFFDPNADVDFLGLKTLLRQLLDVDSHLVDLSGLSDLILAQPLLGSTVKVESKEADPYAFLSVLNLREHEDKPVIKGLVEYLTRQSKKTRALSSVTKVLESADSVVGLLLTERFINIPTELVPPMYKMLLEEVEWALQEGEPYRFTHYLIPSRTYLELDSLLDQEDKPATKKQKKIAVKPSSQTFYFHPEDELLHKHAVAHGNYSFDTEEAEGQADSRRVFQDVGIKPQGHMILVEASRFGSLVKALEDFVKP